MSLVNRQGDVNTENMGFICSAEPQPHSHSVGNTMPGHKACCIILNVGETEAENKLHVTGFSHILLCAGEALGYYSGESRAGID